MPETSFDIVVIGGGPGGYVAAIRAAQLGLKTAVVEREHLGGICLNWGCIPTKALMRASEIHHLLHRLGEYGFSAKEISFDAKKLVARSRAVARQLSNGVGFLMRKNKIAVFDGEGKLAGPGKVAVSGKTTGELTAKHVILASGARARTLPGLEADGKLVWTYKEAMVPEAIPKSLLVVGSGAIGMEFASVYRDMGAEVTVVEVLDRILPAEDEEISAFARKAFEKQGIKIHTGATVAELKRDGNRATAVIDAGGKRTEVAVERVISAVGITGNTETLGLDGTRVEIARGHVVVDAMLRTGEPGVYAIGDLVGPPWLAHKAMHEGVLCVEAIAGIGGLHPMDKTRIPGCTSKLGLFSYIGNGKAISLGEAEGLVKTVFDAKTVELLGFFFVDAEATE